MEAQGCIPTGLHCVWDLPAQQELLLLSGLGKWASTQLGPLSCAISQTCRQALPPLPTPPSSASLHKQPPLGPSLPCALLLQASVPDMSAMAYLPASLASGAGGMPAAAALPAFDPHVLMASATAAAAAAASDAQQQQAAAQQQQQQQASSRGAGSGSRRRQLVGEGEEGEDDTDWRQPWHHKVGSCAVVVATHCSAFHQHLSGLVLPGQARLGSVSWPVTGGPPDGNSKAASAISCIKSKWATCLRALPAQCAHAAV